MSKFSLVIMLVLLSFPDLFGRNVMIPDSAFKGFLVSNYDTDFDFQISYSEAAAVTGVMNCPYLGIQDLTGIEAFVNLEVLYCYGNNLTTLPDLSSIQGLRVLYCNNNQLTELPNLLHNVALDTIFCHSNHLTEVPPLELLPLLDNLNLNLNDFDECDCPALALLDQKGMTYFTYSLQNSGPMTCPPDPDICFEDPWFETFVYGSIDSNADNKVQLSEIQTYTGTMVYNQLGLTSVTGMEYMTNLTDISLQFNELKTLPDLSRLTQLTGLDCFVNVLEDISGIQNVFSLEDLEVSHNYLTKLPDLLAFPNLRYLNVLNNQIRNDGHLFFPDQLVSLVISLNPLGSLPPISHLDSLTSLSCGDCNLSEIPELPGSGLLESLTVESNNLQFLPAMGHLSQLRQLNVSYNPIHALPDLSPHPELIYLFAIGDQLTTIPDLQSLIHLFQVDFSHNRISELPATWPIPLTGNLSLNLEDNQLSQLPDFSSIQTLVLNVINNRLTTCPQMSGLGFLQLEYNFLDQDDCDDLSKLHDEMGSNLKFNPQGNINLTNPQWGNWPGQAVLMEWVALVSSHPYETVLECGF